MITLKLFVPFLSLLLFACSNSASPEKQYPSTLQRVEPEVYSEKDSLSNQQVDGRYMKTGFYFLSNGLEGVKKRVDHSDKIYSLAPTPFASVRNIIKTELVKVQLSTGVATQLCLTMDKKGTYDLKTGTGDLLHREMAVVVANHLLYVVEISAGIETGHTCIFLMGYTEEEMKAMRDAVDNKR